MEEEEEEGRRGGEKKKEEEVELRKMDVQAEPLIVGLNQREDETQGEKWRPDIVSVTDRIKPAPLIHSHHLATSCRTISFSLKCKMHTIQP